jgi:hypothetical protein
MSKGAIARYKSPFNLISRFDFLRLADDWSYSLLPEEQEEVITRIPPFRLPSLGAEMHKKEARW